MMAQLKNVTSFFMRLADKAQPFFKFLYAKSQPLRVIVSPYWRFLIDKFNVYYQKLTRPIESPIDVDNGLKLDIDPSGHIRAVGIVAITTVTVFFIWSASAPIDKGVPASGTVITASNKKDIKYLNGGIVDDIFVREGEFVTQGQQLIRINPTQTQASVNATKESIFAIQEQLKGLKAGIEQKKIQLAILIEQVDALRQLSKEGYIARSNLLDKERETSQLRASIAEDTATVEKLNRQINESTERLSTYTFEYENTLIKSPVDGYVQGLAVFTKGGSIVPGMHLMDIVPKNDDLVIEAQVPIHLIDKVKPNLSVDVIFSAFNQNRTPHIPATVTMVSPDKLLDEKNGSPYYKILVSITKKGKEMLQDLQIRPGMPAEVLIKTGERTALNYLLKPFIDRTYSSFREE